MKMYKRIFGVLLCLCMLLGAVSLAGAEGETAENETVVPLSSAEGETVEYAGSTGHSHRLCVNVEEALCTDPEHKKSGSHDTATFDKVLTYDNGVLGYNDSTITKSSDEYELPAGNYYLTNNLTVDGSIKITGKVTLCLNGCTITKTGEGYEAITVDSGTLTLCNCKSSGTITHGVDGNNDKITGYGVSVTNGGSFTMYNGTISGNKVGSNIFGAGVKVGSNGTFTMYGGTISENEASKQGGGGVYVDNNGIFNIYGGEITGNTAAEGGGVYVNSNGTFTMHGGAITNNTAQENSSYGGGGVCSFGTFVMERGTISNNTTSKRGGGVCIRNGTFTMKNGTIIGNTAGTDGGGVSIDGGSSDTTMTISGGMITNNTAEGGNGGGVYLRSNPQLTITGSVDITYNTAGDSGGGVYFGYSTKALNIFGSVSIAKNTATNNGGGVCIGDSNGQFKLSGSVNITDNVKGGTITNGTLNGGTPNNFYLPSGKYITITGALTGAPIGVTTQDTPSENGYVTIAKSDTANLLDSSKFNYENNSALDKVVVGSELVVCAHNWQDATCVKPKTCLLCHKEQGDKDPTNHTGTIDDSKWLSGDDTHWKVYKCCGAKANEESHTYGMSVVDNKYLKTSATCTQYAVYYKSCVCGEWSTAADIFEDETGGKVAHEYEWTSDDEYHWKACKNCNNEEAGTKGQHSWNEKITKAATCAETGTREDTCTKAECGKTRTVTLDSLGHKASTEWTSDANGHWHACTRSNCDAKIEANQHKEATDNAVAATCTTPGKTEGKHCDVCKKVLVAQQELPALDHDWKAATCTEPKTCKRAGCGATDGAPLGHTGGKATCVAQAVCETCKQPYGDRDPDNHDLEHHDAKAATCTEKGWNAYDTCKREGCGYTTYVELPALKHDLEHHEAKAATCTEKGWNAYDTCKREGCGYTTYKEIAALNHDLKHHEAKAATCTEIGWDAYDTCKREGCGYTTYKEIGKLDHDFANGTYLSNDTQHWKKCKDCGFEDTAHPESHNVVIDKAKPATTTETGLTEGKHCGVCGKVLVAQEVTPKLPRYYYNSTTTTKDTTKKDTTKSPGTFDPGVGVYALTAVLSVTGMAWVGRKKH